MIAVRIFGSIDYYPLSDLMREAAQTLCSGDVRGDTSFDRTKVVHLKCPQNCCVYGAVIPLCYASGSIQISYTRVDLRSGRVNLESRERSFAGPHYGGRSWLLGFENFAECG